MSKIKRVKHISFFPVEDMFENVELHLHQKFGESVTDFTRFVPTEEAVRSLPAGDIGLQHYDFADGRDDGRAVPVGRKRGADISEISEAVIEGQASIKAQFEQYKAENGLNQGVSNAGKTGE